VSPSEKLHAPPVIIGKIANLTNAPPFELGDSGNRNSQQPDDIDMDSNPGMDLDQMNQSADRASALMKTLGHRDRLMILCQLAESEKSVGQIAELLEISQSPLSQHLSRMRKEGLVETRREAQTIYYSLKSGEAQRIVEVLYELFCAKDGCPA
jgi:DNA-binding transcriptional ArsR family regulator